MQRINYKFYFLIILFYISLMSLGKSQIIKEIEVIGNERISKQTIIMFSSVSVPENITQNKLNNILKDLYETNYFKDVNVKISQEKIIITVKENPVIENINFDGIKSKTLRSKVLKNTKLKSRSSYNEFLIKNDKNSIVSSLKNLGYYQSKVEVFVEELSNNKVNIDFKIDIGSKAKIKKITFVGNKIFKDSKLKNIILSEEYKFWKFISGKKYLNQNIVDFDLRLLKNFYLNKGYYNVVVNSSFAKLISSDEFELIYNIEANEIVYFNNIDLKLPSDYDNKNFKKLYDLFSSLKGKKYSINSIEKILNEIDKISITEQFQSVRSTVQENVDNGLINLTFNIEESDKFFVEKINIFGNNVTEETVIRNKLEIDEGDPFNEVLLTKSINNIKGTNFFKSVKEEILSNENKDKTINIYVEEKPTGEIAAGAGYGTDGSTIFFAISENNYLGKGIDLDTNLELSPQRIKGSFRTTNPNYKNTDYSLSLSIEADEIDQLSNFGYKSNKTGFSIGTKFEYYDDLFLGLGTSTYYETIDTDSTASSRQKKQEGDYWDSFINIDFFYDKRNQKFKTSEGYFSNYTLNIPVLSTNYSLTSGYSYKYFSELYENNVSTIGFSLKGSTSITDKDIKLSERLYIPSNKLRGFVRGKVGPKDGDDYIGGNYITSLNFSSTLPQILSNLQNVDFLIFFDAANVWGVDYDSTIDDSSQIRSSFGIGVDWFTPIGPLNFSFAQDLSKHENDKTESFRFNLGTTF